MNVGLFDYGFRLTVTALKDSGTDSLNLKYPIT